ncbi:Gfo/Idh/MocA family protein [Coraliomargarita akajimensis]|uniref:Oxidoreductase domain protein n=1 Tax=Coraliomargarita akajimensis (strain DSM 45221 / IAM 15411 / JCM 23193 / KCTC 12865 / 04OKA010-24) TaxID=583355 RepID=D5EQY9_CORAD|nr:Gfo/Idh/MocA family oxidoreductase [Coraliomargarita akajimensis]ADE53982.1 oxidoreductase domain protein [Coraliomargarita akajimensis DSM 45221]
MKRRSFLQTSLAAGAAGLILPSRVWAGPSKNGTMQVGLIGCGRMGCANLRGVLAKGMQADASARVVAVCDPDTRRMANAKAIIQSFYKERGEAAVEVKEYEDFRDMLAESSLDAVVIATQDRWHAIQGITAANAGKHIFMQKPLTYSIPEGQALVEAVRRNGITLQVGSQQRSSVYFRRVCNIVRNEWLGKLKEIVVEIPTDKGSQPYVEMPVPENLNYDLWLGPAASTPYTELGVHTQTILDNRSYKGRPGWLQREDFCLGMITGWGSHMYDIAQWAMGTDMDGGPVSVSSKGAFPDRGIFNVHVDYEGEAHYDSGVVLRSKNGSAGVKFIMENGEARCWRGGMTCSDPELLRRQPADGEVSLYESKGGHEYDWLKAAHQGRDGVCPVEGGHRTNTICVLHHISMKLGGRELKWDPKTEKIIGDSEAAKMLHVPMRGDWKLPEA